MDISGEPSEVHIAGDMNLDALGDRWLQSDYCLHSLSKMVQSACRLGNFNQIVEHPTRCQFNSVSGETNKSCIDHIYTNCKFRCSPVSIISFGNSDHDVIGYTRYAKDPPIVSKTIKVRSYKNFSREKFVADLDNVDWTPVYVCKEIDNAVEIFTNIFTGILNKHAPWIKFQKRKKSTPWITQKTINLIKERNMLKENAFNLSKAGLDSSQAWLSFKKLRNKK